MPLAAIVAPPFNRLVDAQDYRLMSRNKDLEEWEQEQTTEGPAGPARTIEDKVVGLSALKPITRRTAATVRRLGAKIAPTSRILADSQTRRLKTGANT
jgi:hypothetical protein